MKYIIKRDKGPLNGSVSTEINGQLYDIVESVKNTGLERISDFVLDDTNTLIKNPPGQILEDSPELGRIQELLLG